jgi:stage V sporulation protein G
MITEKTAIEITNVQVFPMKETNGKLRAFARVLLNDELQLTGLRIYEGANGLFVAYPNDPSYKGEDYRQLFYPVTRELRDSIENACVEKFTETLKGSNS